MAKMMLPVLTMCAVRLTPAILLRRAINNAAGERSEPTASVMRRQQQLLVRWQRSAVQHRASIPVGATLSHDVGDNLILGRR